MSGKKLVILHFFFRHNCNKSLWKNIFLASLYLQPSPLVRAPAQMTIFPSPNYLLLCSLLSARPSTVSPFLWKTIYNASNALSTSSIILDDEGLPYFYSVPLLIVLHEAKNMAVDRWLHINLQLPDNHIHFSKTIHSSE